jgi:bacteriorhodopsin
MDIVNILYALISLAVVVLIIYIILWALAQLGLAIPENIKKVIWVILVLLALVFIIQHFFYGGGYIGLPRHR